MPGAGPSGPATTWWSHTPRPGSGPWPDPARSSGGVAGGRRARAPPLGLGAAQGWVDAGRALVGAVLVADLVALLGVEGEGGTIAIQDITMSPCRRSPDDSRPALGMSSYCVPDEEAQRPSLC